MNVFWPDGEHYNHVYDDECVATHQSAGLGAPLPSTGRLAPFLASLQCTPACSAAGGCSRGAIRVRASVNNN
jgi:hypothetical protein